MLLGMLLWELLRVLSWVLLRLLLVLLMWMEGVRVIIRRWGHGYWSGIDTEWDWVDGAGEVGMRECLRGGDTLRGVEF
jgi:hypothetical protein